MEYADDADLQGKLVLAKNTHRPLSEEAILAIFVQIVRALHHLHSQGVIHRDVKVQRNC